MSAMTKEKTKTTTTMNKNTYQTKPTTTMTTRTTTTTRTVTHDMIATRAYQIYRTGKGGTATDHWLQAERELKNN